ncbi:hypothetical protein [Dactylosporangium sp. CA-233914]|uniref:hypothetical protein n=1 Tax=Dactylosporangium sp. CA-233914 TaxID=3239934 RepID=UPI003D928BF6
MTALRRVTLPVTGNEARVSLPTGAGVHRWPMADAGNSFSARLAGVVRMTTGTLPGGRTAALVAARPWPSDSPHIRPTWPGAADSSRTCRQPSPPGRKVTSTTAR